MYEGMAWWRCSEVRHTPPNCLGWGPEAQRGMSIPSARLSGKSRRLPTANNHTANTRVRASPQQQHSEPRVRTAYIHVASLANPRTQHTDSTPAYIANRSTIAAHPTRVCVHCQPLQQRLSQASLEETRLHALQLALQQVSTRAHTHQGPCRASSAEPRHQQR